MHPPDVHTTRELGLRDVVLSAWCRVLVLVNIPADIVRHVNAGINTLLQSRDIQDAMALEALTVAGGDTARMGDMAAREIAFWTRVVKNAGLQTT